MKLILRLAVIAAVLLTLSVDASFAGTVTAVRPAPYPSYEAGGPASLIITTSDPVQIHAPVYRFREKNGAPDGLQPTLEGYTDENGRFEIHISNIPAGIEGVYTNERYAVENSWGPTSDPLNFTVSAPLSAACGCEHFGTQFDQVCQAIPNPQSSGPGEQYRYSWSVSPAGYFPNPPNPLSSIVQVDCGGAGKLKVSVTVERLVNGVVLGSGSAICSSGTPTCGIAN